MIFAREVTDSLTSLVKKLDAANAKNAKANLRTFVVFCNDDEKLEGQLKELAKKEKISHTVLAIVDRKAGPPGYDLSADADVTAVLYVGRNVKANHAFKKGGLNAKAIDAILADLPKILKK